MASASVGDKKLTSDFRVKCNGFGADLSRNFCQPMLSEPPTLLTAKEACGKYFCNIVLL